MKRLNLLVIVALLLSLVGFAPAARAVGPLYVDPLGSDLNACTVPGASACKTIQGALTKAVANDTINVAAGTYVETGQIVISMNLTIIGASQTTTIIKPSADTGGTANVDGSAWWLVQAGNTFNLSNVTLDGAGWKIYYAILSHGPGTIQNNIVQNIGYNPSGPTYQGRGISVYGAVMTIANNTLSNIGRIGIYIREAGASGTVVSGNTYVGKGNGNWLDYGIEVEKGAYITISGNTISGCTGVATVDGSTSAGILVTTYFAPGTGATITGNTITGNTVGIAVGYLASDTSTVVAHNNIITGNTDKGIDSTNPTVDAENNWWGCSAGPGNAGCDSVTPVKVDYTPWLTSMPAQTWVKHSGNPVAPSGLCGQSQPSRPAIVMESASNYKMYFTTHPGTAGAQIYLATTTNGGLSWTCANSGNHVLPVGGAGAWDASRVVARQLSRTGRVTTRCGTAVAARRLPGQSAMPHPPMVSPGLSMVAIQSCRWAVYWPGIPRSCASRRSSTMAEPTTCGTPAQPSGHTSRSAMPPLRMVSPGRKMAPIPC